MSQRYPLSIAIPLLWKRLVRRARRPVSQEDFNERVLYIEVAFQAIIEAGVMSFLAVFLVRLGSPNWLVGLYSSLPALVMSLAILPMGALVQEQKSLVKAANWGRLIFRGGISLFALLPLWPTVAAYIMVGLRSLLSIPAAASNVAFTTILGQATSGERRPRMISTRLAVNGLVGAAIGFLAGQWLDAVRFPFNYQVLFISVTVAGLFSVYMLSKLNLPATDEPARGIRRTGNIREMLDMIKGAPLFRNYCIAALIFRLSMSMPSALYSIYKVRVLGASDAWIGVLLTVERGLSVATYLGLGHLLSRPKIRRWLWLSVLGVALYPLTTALATTPEMLLIPALCGALFGAGMNIFMTNTLFKVSPEDRRAPFVAVDVFIANLTAFVAPMLGTALADVSTITLAFVVVAIIRFLGGIAFWRLGVTQEI